VYQDSKFSNTWATRLFLGLANRADYSFKSAYWISAYLSTDVALNGDSGNDGRFRYCRIRVRQP